MSNPFTKQLVYENIDGQKIRIVRAFDYHVGHKGSGEVIHVPAGFVCDGMSYPLRWVVAAVLLVGVTAGVFPNPYTIGFAVLVLTAIGLGLDITPQGKGVKAGVIHDRLYWLNGRPAGNGKSYSRKEADQIFREALEVSGVNPVSRFVRYYSLRVCGGFAWNAHAKRIKKEATQPEHPTQ